MDERFRRVRRSGAGPDAGGLSRGGSALRRAGVSSPLVPGVVRVLLGVMLGVVAFGSVETLGPSPNTLLELGVLSGFELVYGAALGLLALIPIAALQGVGLVRGSRLAWGLPRCTTPTLAKRWTPPADLWPLSRGPLCGPRRA